MYFKDKIQRMASAVKTFYKEDTMSKKVLILSGSPRKGGNSDILCDEFLRGTPATAQAYEMGKNV